MRHIFVKDKDGKTMMVNIPSINNDVSWESSPAEPITGCIKLRYADDGYTVEGYVEEPCT